MPVTRWDAVESSALQYGESLYSTVMETISEASETVSEPETWEVFPEETSVSHTERKKKNKKKYWIPVLVAAAAVAAATALVLTRKGRGGKGTGEWDDFQ